MKMSADASPKRIIGGRHLFNLMVGACIGSFLACPSRPKTAPPASLQPETSVVPMPSEPSKPQTQVVEKEVSFHRDVLPVLRALAGDCHTAENMAGNYTLDSYEAVMGTGTDSTPNVIKGKPDSSLLYLYLLKGHPFGKKPDSTQLEIIRKWILQGAKNN